jgi:cytochrome-b5 reductase
LKQLALLGGIGLAGYYVYSTYGASGAKAAAAPLVEAPAVFTGGDQGFISLKLEHAETINHNTKRFRFSFDDPNSVSGLQVACEIKPCDREQGKAAKHVLKLHS